MRLIVAAVGRAGSDPAGQLFEDYRRRLPWPLELREVRAFGGGGRGLEREAAALLKGLPQAAYVVALDGGGEALASKALAGRIAAVRDRGTPVMAFLIGGADGLGEAALARADMVLSLGPMTWPHLLARAMLVEQLWRAASILSGHPYHRG